LKLSPLRFGRGRALLQPTPGVSPHVANSSVLTHSASPALRPPRAPPCAVAYLFWTMLSRRKLEKHARPASTNRAHASVSTVCSADLYRAAVERIWHIQDSQGQNLAWTFWWKPLKRGKLFPLDSEMVPGRGVRFPATPWYTRGCGKMMGVAKRCECFCWEGGWAVCRLVARLVGALIWSSSLHHYSRYRSCDSPCAVR